MGFFLRTNSGSTQNLWGMRLTVRLELYDRSESFWSLNPKAFHINCTPSSICVLHILHEKALG